MPKDTAREIRWEVRSENHPVTHKFNVLIINDNRGIRRAQQKLKEALQPTDELRTRTEGTIRGTDLRYSLISFDSYIPNPDSVEWRSVYSGAIKRDRALAERETDSGLPDYVDEQMAA